MPYQFNGYRRHNHQFGIGRTVWNTTRISPDSEGILNAVPGGIAWVSLVIVVIAAIKVPLAMMFGAALLASYTAIRFAFAGVAVILGLKKIRRWEAMDWMAEYQERAGTESIPLNEVHHLVIIPNYREDLQTLRRTLDHLVGQSIVGGQISIALAMESAETEALGKAETLQAEYQEFFANFFVAMHPKGLHQEMQCKSANQAWAARWARRQLVDEMNYDIHNIVVTTMDADTLWHPNYLEALGVLFATDEKRYSTFWQAPIRYHSNVWQINSFMRLLHGYATNWELAYLAASWWQALPMSSYSLSLKLLDTAGYWDSDVIADEWHMYIKSFFKREGDLLLRPIFLPFLASATGGTGLIDSIRQRYKQTRRHAWGAKEIGYTIAQIRNNPQVNRARSFHLLFRVAHDNLLAGAGWIIITAGTQLPALLHQDSMSGWVASPPFILLQLAFFLITIMTILFWWVDIRTRPAREAPLTRNEWLLSLLNIPALPIVTLFCVAIPVLEAQTRLMLGIPIEFRVTRKLFR